MSNISSSSSSFWGQKSINARTTEYGRSGSVLGKEVSTLFFGAVASGTDSPVKIVGMHVTGAKDVANVKLGVTGANFGYDLDGVLLYSVADSVAALPEPYIPFPGINRSGRGDDPDNVLVGQLGTTFQSKFVAMKIRNYERFVHPCQMTFEWFFDFSLPAFQFEESSSSASSMSSQSVETSSSS